MSAVGFVERVEKAIIQSTWKKQPKIIEDFVKNYVIKAIKSYTVEGTKLAVSEKRNLLQESLNDTELKKDILDGQKYASWIPDALSFFTPEWAKNLLISNRRDLIIGLNLEELGWLAAQIDEYLEFIFKKQEE